MLDRNRLAASSHPTEPAHAGVATAWDQGWDLPPGSGPFASAEDYDATGILTGVDPCESRYWWMPELQASIESPIAVRGPAAVVERPPRSVHAARRAGSRSTAAA
jgi:hypothetical protein